MAKNRESIGITKASLQFGQQNSKSLYNRLVSSILFGTNETFKQIAISKCEEQLEKIAFVEIEMVAAPVIVLTETINWNIIGTASAIGNACIKRL